MFIETAALKRYGVWSIYGTGIRTEQESRDVKVRCHAKQAGRCTAGCENAPRLIDILIVSSGGDWGPVGAEFLNGWQKVYAENPLAKPEFDIVTGVSIGALIAPFAFSGDERSIDEIVNLYRNPQEDWVKPRGFLYSLPDNVSFAEVPGLECELCNP